MTTTIDVRDAVLNVARATTFVRETHGSNRGEVVDEMIRLTSLDPATRPPWCAASLAWIGYAALRKQWPLKKVAGCMSLYDDAKAKGLIRVVPTQGAIGLLWSATLKRFHHCWLVEDVDVSGLQSTLEGNTNEDGSAEGIGFFARSGDRGRRAKPGDVFIHWWL